MKLVTHCFSAVVRKKHFNLKRALITEGVELLPWNRMHEAQGVVVYNIHHSVAETIGRSLQAGKKVLSLQEGMYAIGWPGSLQGMKKECERANASNIMQFVWSQLDRKNYIATGKDPHLLQHFGNPEHDDLLRDPTVTRHVLGIPQDAFVIVHIDQYAHPSGGPSKQQLHKMFQQVQSLVNLDQKVWAITCLHPKQRRRGMSHERVVTRPFSYPIFDILRLSNMVVTLSSTEGLTAAILDKPIIEYDISASPSRWPFVQHGVAVRAESEAKLRELTKLTMQGSLGLSKKVDYRKEYQVDGHASQRVAQKIKRHFA